MRAYQTVEVPKRLRTRPRDARGYPIPYTVYVDKAKRPHFTINDQERVMEVAKKGLCALCGKKLDNGAWFVGGPICFTHPQGAFIDPASHEDCARYAIQVCPYLAAPSYAKRIDGKTIRAADQHEAIVIGRDDVVPDDRPPLFGLGQAPAYAIQSTGQGMVLTKRGEWLHLEFWRHGEKVDNGELSGLIELDNKRRVA